MAWRFTTAQLLLSREFTKEEPQASDPKMSWGCRHNPGFRAQETPKTSSPEQRRGANPPEGGSPGLVKSLGTHSQVQHVHGHCLLCQHLHRGVSVDSDRAAAHCEAQRGVAQPEGLSPEGHPHQPSSKKTPRPLPVTFPAFRDSAPTPRQAGAGDAPSEPEQNQDLTPAQRSQSSFQQPLAGWESRNPWKCTRPHLDGQSLPCESAKNTIPTHTFPPQPLLPRSPKYLVAVPSSAWTVTTPGRSTWSVGTWEARMPKEPVSVGTSTCFTLAPL